LLKYAQTEEDKTNVRDSLNFYPVTAQIVAIGMLDAMTDSGFVFYQDPAKKQGSLKEQGFEFVIGSEKEILENFWKQIKDCEQFISFNGRGLTVRLF